MIADITQRDIDYTGIPREEVSFPEFVQLYINHRHAHGVSIGELEEAFNTIVETCDGYGSVSKDDFVDTICLKGRHLKHQQTCIDSIDDGCCYR